MRALGGCLALLGLALTVTVFGAWIGAPLLLIGWMMYTREDTQWR